MDRRMKNLQGSELKAILYSKRANLYYLEKCRINVKDGRVVYLTPEKDVNKYWNIPVANTTVLLLGIGTSITHAAVRMLAGAGVMLGFCGNGSTPLFSGTDIEWVSPQNEYRPTEFVQGWMSFWFDERKRLEAAKNFQLSRCNYLEKVWENDRDLSDAEFYVDDPEIERALKNFRKRIKSVNTIQELLGAEATFAKQLYKYAAERTDFNGFVRDNDAKDVMFEDPNRLLNHGNYLAYGLAAEALWVLGIPHAFALMHGKTRRGALVFDVADLIKDAIILPYSFICAGQGMTEQEYRECCINKFTDHKALEFMLNTVKTQSRQWIGGGSV